jgi:glycosyltransferase involved in cell wall biosynthesis
MTDTPPEDAAGPDLRVSVVVPSYRRPQGLAALLESLAGQRLARGAFEVIVSDDGSGPEVEAAARPFEKQIPFFRFERGPHCGPGVARNRGAAMARGHVLAFIDDDCVAPPGWLEQLTAAVENGATIAHGPVRSSVPPMPPFVHSFVVEDRPVCTANFAIGREAFEGLGGFDARVSFVAEDHEFFARARRAGIFPMFVPDAPVLHPPRPGRVRVPGLPSPEDRRAYETLRAFFDLAPEYRAEHVQVNRRLLARGALKLLAVASPLAVAPLFPPVWPAGFAAAVAYGLWKRTRVNRALAAAGESFRVPLSDGLKYGALIPFSDLLSFAERARFGLGMLRQGAWDRRPAGTESR